MKTYGKVIAFAMSVMIGGMPGLGPQLGYAEEPDLPIIDASEFEDIDDLKMEVKDLLNEAGAVKCYYDGNFSVKGMGKRTVGTALVCTGIAVVMFALFPPAGVAATAAVVSGQVAVGALSTILGGALFQEGINLFDVIIFGMNAKGKTVATVMVKGIEKNDAIDLMEYLNEVIKKSKEVEALYAQAETDK